MINCTIKRKAVGIIAIVLIIGPTIFSPMTYAKQNYNKQYEFSPQEVLILTDENTVTTRKAAIVLKSLLEQYIDVNIISISSWYQLSNIVHESAANRLIVHVFHGTKEGMIIEKVLIPWSKVSKSLVAHTSTYQLFMSCYSSIITSKSKYVLLTFPGPTDYVISVIHVAVIIGHLSHNSALLTSLKSKVSDSQSALLARLFFKFEPLWSNYTHYVLTSLAINEVCNSIGWLNDILKQNSLLPSGLNESIIAAYTNPDYEDYPNGDPLSFDNITDLVDTLVNNRTEVDIALRHVSFSATGSFHFQFPEWFYEPDLFDFLKSNYGEPELWSMVQKLDSLDGTQDGTIAYDTDITGNALSRLFDCFDIAHNDYFSGTNYNWAQALSRAVHYLQDQQVPYHTALVDEFNRTVEHLNILVSFSMKDTWVSIAKSHGLTEDYANWFYDNKFEPIFRDYLAHNQTISWDLIEDFVGEAVGILGLFSLLICLLPPLIAIIDVVLISLTVYKAAQTTYDALKEFNDTVSAYVDDIKAKLDILERNNKRFKNQHDYVEAMVESKYITQWYSDISVYVHNNLLEAHNYAKQLVNTEQRTTLVNNWIGESRDIAQMLFDSVDTSESYDRQPQGVTKAIKERLKQAALQSVAIYEAFFIRIIYLHDTDGDGIADFWEEKVFKTPANSAKRTVIITQVKLISGSPRISSSTWEVDLEIEETRPWKDIKVSIGYQLSSTGEKVYVKDQNYQNYNAFYLGLGGGITVTTGTFYKTVVETFTIPVCIADIKNIVVSVTFVEWQIAAIQQLTLDTPLAFNQQSTILFTSHNVQVVSIPPELQQGL